ncbi:hypothetical protein SLEP1_g43800 [Rubroshorea leprosula]|uniref:Uncharacterized protein n=1 Tax=Rubroshorea leprosula TaxID=152421 RepID=A0AAV5LE60_9ROSI|nr:hypothetical protein SLEP1_g43800 [Rubroshorea leprosula]
MGEASKERLRELTYSGESQMKKGPPMASRPSADFQPLNLFLKMSPRHNGSTLYDSFELQAVTCQLNKAMQMSLASSPTYIRYLQSPLYSQRLDHIRKENANATKKVSYPQVTSTTGNRKARTKETEIVTGGIVARLWKKVKHGVLKNKKKVRAESSQHG